MLKRKINPSTEGRDLSIRSCTKDLRLRRVFSLGSDSKGIESNDNGGADVGSCEAAGGKDPSMDVEIKDASKECEKDSNSSGGINKTGFLPKGILKKPSGSGCDREDLIQRTPPENVITVDTGAANNCQNTFPKNKARAAPCSRQKLVQVHGSISYRRLLPYLMEMDKDEVQVSSTEEQSFTPNVDSPNSILTGNLDFAEIPVSKTPNLGKPEEITPPILVSTVAQSSEIPTAENIRSNSTKLPIEPQPPLDDSIQAILVESAEKVTPPILVPIVVQSSEIPTAENIRSNSTKLPVEPQPPLDDSIQAMEVLCSPQLVSSVSSVQETLTIDELACGNVNKRGEVITSTKTGEIKGDKTVGCKGICTCLDCVLFRIHAERSFEFSKKQLNEADEIIRGLVTEICCLRHILEKSIGNRCSDCSQVYQDELIKVVCERASLTEKLATMRTKQMSMDLDAHSKQQEARVVFSDCINQKIIPSSLETNPREHS